MADIQADLLPEDVEIELDQELLPGNCLHRDVRALAGVLDFSIDEIQYICMKPSPFKFLLDQWCKREGKRATLELLQSVLLEIQRPDLAEKVQNTIQSLRKSNFKQLNSLENLQDKRVKRRDEDCTFLTPKNEDESDHDKSPYVYTVYFKESQEYEQNINDFVNGLRKDFGVDVHTKHMDLDYQSNKQFYVFESLQRADFVFVFCSSAFKQTKQLKEKNMSTLSDQYKELLFSLNFIVRDIYRNKGVNSKYIPVLMGDISNCNVPDILLTPKRYKIPDEKESLVRRIFQTADFALPPIAQQKKFIPRLLNK